ncbi:MAG: Type 1 glutamine amidotransferase-like domain-containing protein [Lachnospiraceae bacterium]|nr:Type 1 glutamine amidotransferase-like domain-containing protein [Lachnospiraceae bacterium]
MIAFLTSSPNGRYRETDRRSVVPLNPANGFTNNLKKYWKDEANGLLLSAMPDLSEINDGICASMRDTFTASGFPVGSLEVCDNRDFSQVQRLGNFDFLILGGGHVPTQHAFFEEIGLRKALQKYDGIVIGISAGTMNSAKLVYAQPEEEGESVDPAYQKFLNGLDITDINILPHYQAVKDDVLDGRRLFEDITYADSYGHKFYAIVDGSYLLVENGEQTLYGEAWLILDGQIQQVCRMGEALSLGCRQ